MPAWTPCPDNCLARFDRDSLQRHWAQLHLGDGQSWPTDPALLEGWRLYHEGAFEAAATAGLARSNAMRIDARDVEPVATAMVVVLTYWLSFEYVRDPRNALEPASAGAALLRGAFHVLSLLMPYLEPGQREHLLGLVDPYQKTDPKP